MSTAPTPSRRLSDAELQHLIDRAAHEAAKRAVEAAFTSLGLDPHDPDHVAAWHADRLWTRSAREGSGRLKTAAVTSVVGTVITALLYGVWTLVKLNPPSN